MLLCGLVSVILAIALKYPWLTTPELALITKTPAFKAFQYLVLVLGYIFALFSLILRKDKSLAFAALALVMAAALMGGSSNEQIAYLSPCLRSLKFSAIVWSTGDNQVLAP